nr:MAG TPA: hypothetical protein [Caudoviricetes sp.]
MPAEGSRSPSDGLSRAGGAVIPAQGGQAAREAPTTSQVSAGAGVVRW